MVAAARIVNGIPLALRYASVLALALSSGIGLSALAAIHEM